MEIQIIVTQNGKLSIFSKQGDFIEGKEKIDLILQILKAEEIKFDFLGDVEQHSHEKPMISMQNKSKN